MAQAQTEALRPRPPNPRLAKRYVCESFCDTAAWLFAGLRRHPEFTLSALDRRQRKRWFHPSFLPPARPISI